MTETVRLAWYAGSWTMHTDALGNFTHKTWKPSPRLDMTPEQQWTQNIKADEINGKTSCSDTSQAHTRTPPHI